MAKIISYNLFEGASSTYSKLVEFIKAEDPDVACFQEVNGWQDDDFAQAKNFAEQTGFRHFCFGNSNTDYKLATFSRLPFSRQEVHTDGFWHSVIETDLQVNNQTITLFNVHLSPGTEEFRLTEVEHLLAFVSARANPTLLIGDFNSLSRRDQYHSSFLDQLQKADVKKFGDRELEFRVIDKLEAAGLTDILAMNGQADPTIPTAFNKDPDHQFSSRVDYAFAPGKVAKLITHAEVHKTEITDNVSDHLPLVLTLDI